MFGRMEYICRIFQAISNQIMFLQRPRILRSIAFVSAEPGQLGPALQFPQADVQAYEPVLHRRHEPAGRGTRSTQLASYGEGQ